MEVALAVALFVLARGWIWRLEDGAGPGRLRLFVGCGLLYAGLYGCALGWVVASNHILGVFAAFFSFPLVFGGVRRLAGYFGFNPVYYVASTGAFAALGLFFSLIVLIARGPGVVTGVLPPFFVGAFVLLTHLARGWDEKALRDPNDRGEGPHWKPGP